MNPLNLLTRTGDKVGSVGAIISAMGCAMCFPAIASLGGAVGMGFLSQWEGAFINTLLPVFALLTLLLNALGYLSHLQMKRSIAGMIGPVLLLLSLYPWFQYGWSTYVTYSALALMVVVSIADLIYPANHRCNGPDGIAKFEPAHKRPTI
ncbi:Mercuric transport protein, MerC [hydrothermal vent metagenome]|uniref:Mercuric transport protein, MerC n=1 Tax=hydrothermal vent metagenome TaxID=652676 RepID=A0A3B0YIT2_9ZZZZ